MAHFCLKAHWFAANWAGHSPVLLALSSANGPRAIEEVVDDLGGGAKEEQIHAT